MTPLRKKMIRELELQRKANGTVKSYVRSVAELATFHGKSPDLLDIEEVRDFVHYLIVGKKLSWFGSAVVSVALLPGACPSLSYTSQCDLLVNGWQQERRRRTHRGAFC